MVVGLIVGGLSQTAKPGRTAVLNLEVGLVMKSGDVKRIARETFYLLNREPGQLLVDAGLGDEKAKDDAGEALSDLCSKQMMATNLSPNAVKGGAAGIQERMAVIEKATVAKATTDFVGKATFAAPRPAKSFVFGISHTWPSCRVWSVPWI